MRISDHLYMLSGAPYGQTGNVYGVRHETGFFMIDCGRDREALEIIQENLYDYGFSGPPSHLFLTHAHFDHSGNAWYFQQQGGALVCHESEASALETGGELVSDYACKDEFRTCRAAHRLKGGEKFSLGSLVLKAIHAPGHSAGSMLYRMELDGKTMLFTGDTVSTELTGWGELDAALGWEGGYDFDRAQYLETLHRIYRMPASCILPGHGVPAMRNASQLLKSAFCKGLLRLR